MPSGSAHRWPLLAMLTSSYGLGALGMLGVSPLSPALVEGFALGRLEVALIVPAIYLSGLLFSVPGGHLADRWGVRPTYVSGLVVSGAGMGLGALTTRFEAFLACLALAGIGWSVVNPVLGKAIVALFPPRERGIAMGIKQTGLTMGGVIGALVLPAVALGWGWRAAVALCGAAMALPAAALWPALAPLARAEPVRWAATSATPRGAWWWLERPALRVFFAAGVALGMVQSAVLAYLPLFSVQVLGFSLVGAGMLVAVSQAGGAVARLGLGAASDRWLEGRRPSWLVLTSGIAAGSCLLFAWLPSSTPLLVGVSAFGVGVGAYGWVGIFFVISAEAGGERQAGLLTGVAFAAIVVGLVVGAPLFGVVLQTWDSYGTAWSAVTAISAATALGIGAAARAIHAECHPAV